ncbi:hypothetical protein P3X46_025972 [Hevea brasiliensis]|uniref:Uncharacterized protein n=1 Tax=Hevea brasiliensis TaxID=3981 RepID=A0ABQ9KV48_HEVBR|nr:hypothetical protein P3X46_025972 [Hevea brasiliensis]
MFSHPQKFHFGNCWLQESSCKLLFRQVGVHTLIWVSSTKLNVAGKPFSYGVQTCILITRTDCHHVKLELLPFAPLEIQKMCVYLLRIIWNIFKFCSKKKCTGSNAPNSFSFDQGILIKDTS